MASVVVVAAALSTACGSDDATQTTGSSPSTPVPASTSTTTAPATTGAPTTAPPTSAPEPVSACTEGELPAAGAVDLTTGDVRWTVCSAAEVYRTLVGAFDDVVVVSETAYPDAEAVALSVTDGAERWRRATVTQPVETPRGPTAGVGVVLRMLSDGLGGVGLAGLDVATGEVVWQLAEPFVVLGQSETTAVVASFDPTVGSAPVLEGIDLATGAEVWTSPLVFADLSGVGVSRGPAAVWDGTIAVPTGDSLTALDIDSGAVRWVGPQTDHPEAADGVVIGTADSGRTIRALDAFSGELLWEAPGRPSYGDLLAIGDGVVVVNALDRPALVAYNVRTGNERWRIDAAGIGEPQLIAGTAVVALWEQRLSAVSTSNGAVLWSADAPFGSPWMSSVAVDATTVYVSVNSRPWGD